jgi:hypothetical protein
MTIDGRPKQLDGGTETNLVRARASLDGLSVGDAFGELFFARRARIAVREAPTDVAWRWTDDTARASAAMTYQVNT